jgi:hypothetical protein
MRTREQEKLLRQWGIEQKYWPATEAGAKAMLDSLKQRYEQSKSKKENRDE